MTPRGNPLIAAATEWMQSVFGADWATKFHRSHWLSLAKPLVFCRLCGHHCETTQHLVALRKPCGGVPPTGDVYHSRKEKIERGRHPTKKDKTLERAIPLPPGQRE